jgi:hypothetical protein
MLESFSAIYVNQYCCSKLFDFFYNGCHSIATLWGAFTLEWDLKATAIQVYQLVK